MLSEKILKYFNRNYCTSKYYFSPNWIVLGVNNVCNLHCKMCDVGTQNLTTNFAKNLVGTSPLNMPLDLIKKVIDQTHTYYPKAKIGYAFTEPLVYLYLQESLAYCKSKKIQTSITTNGLTLKKHAEELVKNGLGELNISLDGPQEIHNHIRGNQKSFQKAIEGIKEIFKYNPKQEVSVYCVITEWNIGELVNFVSYLKEFPLKNIGFMHANFTTNNIAETHNSIFGDKYFATTSNLDEINFDNYDFDLLWEEIKQIKQLNDNRIVFSPEIESFEKLKLFYFSPEIKIKNECREVYSSIMIKSDGSVIPAHGRCYNLTIGNLHNNNLNEIWNSVVMTTFRKDLKKNNGMLTACTRCCSAI